MPTVDKLVQATKGLKVKDVPQAVGKFAGEHYNVKETSSRLVQWFHGYKAQHIDSGSPKPLFDVLGYVGVRASMAVCFCVCLCLCLCRRLCLCL